MFLITDGMPIGGNRKYNKVVKEYDGNRMTFVEADTHFAIQEAKQRGWKIFTFFIGDPGGNSGIFGRPFVKMTTDNLNDVLGYFEKEVKAYLRG